MNVRNNMERGHVGTLLNLLTVSCKMINSSDFVSVNCILYSKLRPPPPELQKKKKKKKNPHPIVVFTVNCYSANELILQF